MLLGFKTMQTDQGVIKTKQGTNLCLIKYKMENYGHREGLDRPLWITASALICIILPEDNNNKISIKIA